MLRRTLPYAILILAAAIFFVLGVAAAPLLNLIPERTFGGHPAATVSLDLSGQVRELQARSARLNETLEANVGRIAELERALGTVRNGPAQSDDVRQVLESRIAELQRALDAARRQNGLLEAKANGLSETQAELLAELDVARVRAADLEDSLDDRTRAAEVRERALTDDVERLSDMISRRDDEIARLRDRIERSVAESLPDTEADAPSPSADTPVAPAAPASPATGGTLADGVAAYQAGDYREAYRIWRALAEAGNARAQFHLGALYYEGRGVARNLTDAHRWLGRAAANGSDAARGMLADVEAELSAGPSR